MTKVKSSIGSEFYTQKIVADPKTPGVAKESRENMHDTSKAGSIEDIDAHYKQYRRCVDAFEEIISENTEPYDVLGVKRLTGADIHKAFVEAAKSQQSWHHAELSVLDQLLTLSTGNREVNIG
jgi:hypothetical protein